MKEETRWADAIVFIVVWIAFCALFYGGVFLVFPDALTKDGAYFEGLMRHNRVFLMLTQLAMLSGTVSAIVVHSRYIVRSPHTFIPKRIRAKYFFAGVALGVILISIVVATLLLSEAITLYFEHVTWDLAYYSVLFLIVACSEELLSRGYIYNILSKATNSNFALVASSLFFSLLHSLNSSITLIGFLNLFLAGILFGLTYRAKDDLSMPIGLHFSWNVLQGPIFGFSVSGFTTISIFQVNQLSPNLSGGTFGIEGSGILSFTILVSIIILLAIDKRSKKFQLNFR